MSLWLFSKREVAIQIHTCELIFTSGIFVDIGKRTTQITRWYQLEGLAFLAGLASDSVDKRLGAAIRCPEGIRQAVMNAISKFP